MYLFKNNLLNLKFDNLLYNKFLIINLINNRYFNAFFYISYFVPNKIR